MRILLHGINFSPELTGIGKYTGEMAAWLTAQGHEVRVVTAPPYYPQWSITAGFSNVWKRELVNLSEYSNSQSNSNEVIFTVFRCPLWIPKKLSGLKRLVHLASFAISSFPAMFAQIFWRPDVVWVVEPPFFCAPQAWMVARLSGAKVWLHIQDFEIDAAFDLGLLKGKTLRRFVAGCESWLMRRFDRVSTISLRMLERVLAKGVLAESALLFPNWVDIQAITQMPAGVTKDFRAELGIAANAVVALYSGNMGAKQGLELLAQAAEMLADNPNIVFVFCGNGAGRESLMSQCQQLENVRFLELQPLEYLGHLLSFADIHLLPQRADAADLVMPSKLTGMLASGRPVVATAHVGTDLAEVVSGCGLVVTPEQPDAFVAAIIRLANEPKLRSNLGLAARAYAEANLDREGILSRFQAELIQLLEG